MLRTSFKRNGFETRTPAVCNRGEKRDAFTLIQPSAWQHFILRNISRRVSSTYFTARAFNKLSDESNLSKRALPQKTRLGNPIDDVFRLASMLKLVFVVVGILFLVGCTWVDKSGTHYLVLGLGVGIMTSTNAPGVQVSESRILGAEFGPHLSGIGLLQSHRVEIDPSLTNDVVVSINARNGGLNVKNFNAQEAYTNIFIQTKNHTQTNQP